MVGKDFDTRDVHTFYFYYDDEGGCWRQLERVAVDEENHVVVSMNDHFTDLINAVVTVPDAPEGESFDPTRIKDIQAADPGASISTIAAPSADTSGDARLAYPIELPPAGTAWLRSSTSATARQRRTAGSARAGTCRCHRSQWTPAGACRATTPRSRPRPTGWAASS